jgi:hypothetical protein
MAPVKGICAKKQHSLKIDKIDLKTQEICSFILQEGCNLKEKHYAKYQFGFCEKHIFQK